MSDKVEFHMLPICIPENTTEIRRLFAEKCERIAELEQERDNLLAFKNAVFADHAQPPVTGEPVITMKQAERALELWRGEYVGQNAKELWAWALSTATAEREG